MRRGPQRDAAFPVEPQFQAREVFFRQRRLRRPVFQQKRAGQIVNQNRNVKFRRILRHHFRSAQVVSSAVVVDAFQIVEKAGGGGLAVHAEAGAVGDAAVRRKKSAAFQIPNSAGQGLHVLGIFLRAKQRRGRQAEQADEKGRAEEGTSVHLAA